MWDNLFSKSKQYLHIVDKLKESELWSFPSFLDILFIPAQGSCKNEQNVPIPGNLAADFFFLL